MKPQQPDTWKPIGNAAMSLVQRLERLRELKAKEDKREKETTE